MKQAADYFLFCFERQKTKSYIKKVISRIDKNDYRFRIALEKNGNLTHTFSEMFQSFNEAKVIVSKNKIYTKNRFQYFKTTNRSLYNQEYNKYTSKGFFDVIYFNEKGELTEGAITNIFI